MTSTLLSMTGYGELARDIGRRRWRCVVQSVNSRYLDCRVRIPHVYISFEPLLRNLLKARLIRGKVDLILNYEALAVGGDDGSSPLIDPILVKKYCSAGFDLLRELEWSEDDTAFRREILSFSLQQAASSQSSFVEEDDLQEHLQALVGDALELHRRSCLQEGDELGSFFMAALSDLGSRIETIEQSAAIMPEVFKERLYSRIRRLVDKEFELDESRLCQEVAHQVDRADISEEIVRFRSHLNQFRDVVVDEKELRKGKKLDFIVQELGREINTITAKANLLELTREAVEIKAVLEQVREQVQNIV